MTKHSEAGSMFRGRKFTDWATIKEALIAREIDASFLLAPMAMQLREDGVPIKIVYFGHRDGTTLVVAKDSDIHEFTDLRGKKIAIPNRNSNQNLLMHRMMKQNGMPEGSIDLRELPPPEHPAALAAKSIDGFIVGEPFPSKAEMDGTARVLGFTKDMWPGFISCVLVVRDELARENPDLVQELVNGIAQSGYWIDQSAEHRMEAADVVGKYYYFQPPALLKWVLSKPPDRVKYTDLAPGKKDLDEIMSLGVEIGILKRPIAFEEYTDPSFALRAPRAPWNLDHLATGTQEEEVEAAAQAAKLKKPAAAASASAAPAQGASAAPAASAPAAP